MRTKILVTSFLLLLPLTVAPAHAGWEEGVAAFRSGDYQAAVQEFEPLVQEQPEVVQYRQMLGQAYLALNQPSKAVAHLRKAYDLKPSENSIRLPLAQAYLHARRHGDALSLLKTIDPEALSKNQQQAYYQLRAKASEMGGDSAELLRDLHAIANNNPNDARAQFNYGKACLSARDADCATSALRAAVRLDPSDAAKKRALAKAYLLAGRSSQGNAKREAYREAAELAGEVVEASASYDNLLLLGEARLGAKQYQSAVQAFDRAAAAQPSSWLPLYYKGQAQTILDRFESAEATLKSALAKTRSASDQNRIWGQLGFVYEKQKSFDEAIAAYQKVGDSQGVARARKNKEIAEENLEVEEYNKQIEELEREREQLEEEMEELPPDLLH